MISSEEINQEGKVRQVEESVPAVNPNTRVNLLRTDVDKDFSIAGLERDRIGGGLRAFAERQIETCPERVIGGKKGRERYRKELSERHPVDAVPYLIAREPYLMLSNLTKNQLRGLIPELRDGVTESNRSSVASAISTIQGILIGRASSGQEQR